MEIRDRVTELRRVGAGELQDHAGNWRRHPQFQKDALRGVLGEVGIAGALTAYVSERQGGLTLIDGHLRRGDYPEAEWPVLVLDVDDEEADLLLATMDPLAALAEAEAERLEALLEGIRTEDEALTAMLAALGAEAESEASLMKGIEVMLDEESAPAGRDLGDRKKQIKPVLYVDDLEVFEKAIRLTGRANRGEAMMEIFGYYLEAHGETGR